jgi:hypothetical protein
MNANRRIEEFLYKISTRHINIDLYNNYQDHKLMPYFINFLLSADKLIKKHNNNLASHFDKEYRDKLMEEFNDA